VWTTSVLSAVRAGSYKMAVQSRRLQRRAAPGCRVPPGPWRSRSNPRRSRLWPAPPSGWDSPIAIARIVPSVVQAVRCTPPIHTPARSSSDNSLNQGEVCLMVGQRTNKGGKEGTIGGGHTTASYSNWWVVMIVIRPRSIRAHRQAGRGWSGREGDGP